MGGDKQLHSQFNALKDDASESESPQKNQVAPSKSKPKDGNEPSPPPPQKVEKPPKQDAMGQPVHSLAFWKSQKAQTLKEHAKQFGLNEQGSNDELCVQLATLCADKLGCEPDTTTKSWLIKIPACDEDDEKPNQQPRKLTRSRSRSKSKPRQQPQPASTSNADKEEGNLLPVLQALNLPADVTKTFHAALGKARVIDLENWSTWVKSLNSAFKSTGEKLAHLAEYGLTGLPALQVLNFVELETRTSTARTAPKRSRQQEPTGEEAGCKPRKVLKPTIKEARQQVTLKGTGSERKESEKVKRKVDFSALEGDSLGVVTLESEEEYDSGGEETEKEADEEKKREAEDLLGNNPHLSDLLLDDEDLLPKRKTTSKSAPAASPKEESESQTDTKSSFFFKGMKIKSKVPGYSDTFFQVPETFAVNYALFEWKPGNFVRGKWYQEMKTISHLFPEDDPIPKESFRREEVRGRIFSLFQVQCRLEKLCFVDLQTSNRKQRDILNNPLSSKLIKYMKALYGTNFFSDYGNRNTSNYNNGNWNGPPGKKDPRHLRSTGKCFNCGDRSHKIKDCPHPPRDKGVPGRDPRRPRD